MGLLDFLNKAVDKAVAFGGEAQNLKGEYEHMSDKALMAEHAKSSNMTKTTAISSLLQDRGYKFSNGKWQKEQS